MASSSNRRYGSSGRSTRRKQVVIGSRDTSDVRYDRGEPKASPSNRHGARQPTQPPSQRSKAGRQVGYERGSAGTSGAARRMANEKRKERDRRRRMIARRRTVAAVLAAAFIGLVGWGLVSLRNSAIFAVENVEVSGVQRISAESIAASASIPADATLLNISTRDVRDRILGQPWVADATVSRRIPHTIKITVTERTPALAVAAEGAMWLVSQDDYWLEAHSAEETFTVPTVSDIEGLHPAAGKKTGSAEIENVLAVVDGLSDELRGRLQRISAPTIDETLLVLEGPIEVYVGSAEDITTKDRIVRGILSEQKEVVYVNVRIVDRPTWRGLKD